LLSITRTARRNAVFRRTDLLINRLVANSLESGAVTAMMAVLELSIYIARPRSMVHVTILATRGNLYSIVLFASLNGRKTYQTRRPQSAADPLSVLRFASGRLGHFTSGGLMDCAANLQRTGHEPGMTTGDSFGAS